MCCMRSVSPNHFLFNASHCSIRLQSVSKKRAHTQRHHSIDAHTTMITKLYMSQAQSQMRVYLVDGQIWCRDAGWTIADSYAVGLLLLLPLPSCCWCCCCCLCCCCCCFFWRCLISEYSCSEQRRSISSSVSVRLCWTCVFEVDWNLFVICRSEEIGLCQIYFQINHTLIGIRTDRTGGLKVSGVHASIAINWLKTNWTVNLMRVLASTSLFICIYLEHNSANRHEHKHTHTQHRVQSTITIYTCKLNRTYTHTCSAYMERVWCRIYCQPVHNNAQINSRHITMANLIIISPQSRQRRARYSRSSVSARTGRHAVISRI